MIVWASTTTPFCPSTTSSDASRTTNCLCAPREDLDEKFGIEKAHDDRPRLHQRPALADVPHKDCAAAAPTAENIIHDDDGAARAVQGAAEPEGQARRLAMRSGSGRVDRGPDLPLRTPVSVQDVNAAVKQAAEVL